MSEDKSKPFRDHTVDENKAHGKFIDSYFTTVTIDHKEITSPPKPDKADYDQQGQT